MSAGCLPDVAPSGSYFVVHELGSPADWTEELDAALDSGYATIVIEPTSLGDVTARWILIGNVLHKSCVLSGATALLVGLVLKSKYLSVPLAACSGLFAGIYALSWQFDPCCKYQIETDPRKVVGLPIHYLRSKSPVILVRKDDKFRKWFHNSVAFSACLTALARLWY